MKNDLIAKHPFGSIRVPVDMLHQSIKPNFYEGDQARIEESVKEQGLRYPLIAWRTTVRKWREWQAINTTHNQPHPEWEDGDPVLVVMAGNNRLEIARNLGVDRISCIIENTTGECSPWANKQRKWWQQNQ